MPALKKRKVMLIELVVLVVVVGLLALVGVPFFQEYQHKAKTAEAVVNIDRMFEAAVRTFDSERSCRSDYCPYKYYLPEDKEWTPPLGTCGDSGCRYGENLPPDKLYFYRHETWRVLEFYVEDPFFYSYQFISCEISVPSESHTKYWTDSEMRKYKALQASEKEGDGCAGKIPPYLARHPEIWTEMESTPYSSEGDALYTTLITA